MFRLNLTIFLLTALILSCEYTIGDINYYKNIEYKPMPGGNFDGKDRSATYYIKNYVNNRDATEEELEDFALYYVNDLFKKTGCRLHTLYVINKPHCHEDYCHKYRYAIVKLEYDGDTAFIQKKPKLTPTPSPKKSKKPAFDPYNLPNMDQLDSIRKAEESK